MGEGRRWGDRIADSTDHTSGFMGTRALTKIQDDQRRQKGESGYMLDSILTCVEHLESRPTERRKGNVKERNKATPKPGVRVTVWV